MASRLGNSHVLAPSLVDELIAFDEFGTRTCVSATECAAPEGAMPEGAMPEDPTSAGGLSVDTFTNEFWTSKQRVASRLHEISYRACFKPQLPRFFIERLTARGDVVYDPFMGRGTTVLEAALLGRVPYGCDINPLSKVLVRPRLEPPSLDAVDARLSEIDFDRAGDGSGAGDRSGAQGADHATIPREDLLLFYHPDTLQELLSLRYYFLKREREGTLDAVDRWIRMVAVNRLTGHSSGFFSVYTMPPNQAVSAASQRKINERRGQTPSRRDVPALIVKKSRALMGGIPDVDVASLREVGARSLLLTGDAHATPEIADGSVALAVTSPPFLDVVDYARDNWLRCWFCGISADDIEVTVIHHLTAWQEKMTEVLAELERVLEPGGHVAFEVGEVRAGALRLEEAVLPCGLSVGLTPVLVLINDQEFTKTANCWGVSNSTKGTNTNRIVLFRKV